MINILKHSIRIALLAGLFAVTQNAQLLRADDEKTPSSAQNASSGIDEASATIPVPNDLATSDVKDAIIRALALRKWTVQETSEGKISASYSRGHMSLFVTLRFNPKEVNVFVGQWDSNARVRKTQERWFANLKKDTFDALVAAKVMKK